MVQRLARGPFKAEIRVRFPLALPNKTRFDKQNSTKSYDLPAAQLSSGASLSCCHKKNPGTCKCRGGDNQVELRSKTMSRLVYGRRAAANKASPARPMPR